MTNETNINKICCNKLMISLGDTNYIDMEIINEETWICGECGKVYKEISLYYDEEVLTELMKNYEEELKQTKIYKELVEDEKQTRHK